MTRITGPVIPIFRLNLTPFIAGSFDLGLIYNIRNSFVTPFMLFFIPMLKEAKYEGYWFARIGVPREHIESVTYVLNNFKVNGIDLKVAEPS